MNVLFQYILEMLVSSGIFFAIYRLLIKKVRRFRWLRMYIISATLVSALLPFIEIPVYHTAIPPLSEADGGIEMEFANIQYDTNGILNDVSPASGYRWLILGLYLSVVAIRTGSVAVRLNSIRKMRIGAAVKIAVDGARKYYIAENSDVRSPFSFIRTIYINGDICREEREIIIAHEQSHIWHRHSEEKLLMYFMETIFWFNPFVWIFGMELNEVQEFEADRDVLSKGYGMRLYRLTIFKQLFGYYPEISCGLKSSFVKRRFVMTTETRKIRFPALRWMAAAVFFVGTVFVMSATTVPYVPDTDIEADRTGRLVGPQVAKDSIDMMIVSLSGSGMTLNGESVADLSEMAERISGKKAEIVEICATDDIPMKMIDDIKQILRKSGNFRVSYEKTGPDLLSVEKILPPELDGSNGSDRPKIIDGSEIADIVQARQQGMLTIKMENPDKILVNYEGFVIGGDKPLADVIAAIVGEGHDTFISVQYERNVSYGLYHHVIAQIDKAYNEARNRFALEKFGKGIGELYDAELEAVKTEIPKRVVEIVPKDVELDIKM